MLEAFDSFNAVLIPLQAFKVLAGRLITSTSTSTSDSTSTSFIVSFDMI